MNNFIRTSIILCCSSAFLLAGDADEIFEKLSKGEFEPRPKGVYETSGWVMTSEDGKSYGRWKLNWQVDAVVKYGISAVPECIKRLGDEKMYIRYIAAASLCRITKKNPIWYTFGYPGKKFNGNKTWSNDAILVWTQWYKNNKQNKSDQTDRLPRHGQE